MTKTLIIGLIALTALLASAPAQTGRSQTTGSPAEIQHLETTLVELEVRLERLEAIAARSTPSYFQDDGPAAPSAPQGRAEGRTPHRIMAYVGVETLETNPDAYAELDRLKKEEAALQSTVDSQERSVASASGRSTSSYRSGYRGSQTISRDRRAKGELLGEYKRKLGKKKGEVKRLERELNEPKQLIFGSWQGKVITLETTRDNSRKLDRIEEGDYLTWSGRRIREDADSQEWVVSTINEVDPRDVPAGAGGRR